LVVDHDLYSRNLLDALSKSWRKYTLWDEINRLNIEVTNRCNADCVYCFREEFNKAVEPKTMPLQDVKCFINEISKFSEYKFKGLQVINLGNNGEPLLHPYIHDIVSYARDRCKVVRISTNLSYLNEKMSYKLLESGLGSICFSVDEIEKNRFEKIRRNLNFDTILNNAVKFKEMRDKGKYKCKISVNPVLCKETMEREKEIIKFWKKISDVKVKMSREIPIGIVDRVQPFFRPNIKPLCNDMVGLKANGDVTPCCFDIFGNYTLGNMYNVSFESIFYGENVKLLRKRLYYLEYIPEHCKICVALPNLIDKKVSLENVRY
jgi:radical SAM protein with 4Fe4S-binding SPASM domain